MQDLNDLYYFVQVVDYCGFAPASRALGIPKSKLSRRIALLEERLGVRLIHRSTRRFSLTDLGQTYYNHCKAMLVEADAAQEAIELTRSEPRGIIRITCPVALLNTRIGPILADFMQQHPQVEVHLEATNRRVDVIGEGVDVAIRVRPPPLEDTDLVMRILGDRAQCIWATPELLKAYPEIHKPEDLTQLPSLSLGVSQGEHIWFLQHKNGEHKSIQHKPRLITRDMTLLRQAALAGVGIVKLPVMMVQAEYAAGLLVPVLPDWQPQREIIHAVFASRRGLLPSVRALIDYLVHEFETCDED